MLAKKRCLEIIGFQKEDSFGFNILGKNYFVQYSKGIFSALPKDFRDILVANFVYCRTKPLCLVSGKSLSYNFSKPDLKDFIDYGIKKDLPRIAFFEKLNANKIIKQFEKSGNLEQFQKKIEDKNKIFSWQTSQNKAVLALSFGKDSLLSYGIAKELGLKIYPIYVMDKNNLNDPEEFFKKKIIKEFSKKEKLQINYLFDGADNVFLNGSFKKNIAELENTNGMLAFSLELIPFVKSFGAKYIIFGNEANFSDYFKKDGKKVYPSFDQSIFYSKKTNQNLKKITKNSVQIVSLVEPIYNIVEMAILRNRYSYLLPYLMSCSPKNNCDKWCYDCPMCAKAFLYFIACGGTASQIGFNQDFFKLKYKRFYPLFNPLINRAYEKPKAVRDEQLLAFFLAFQRGIKGDLISLFEKVYLKEAKSRQSELKKKFLIINKVATIPKEIRSKVINIYKEEIKKIMV